MKKVTIKDVALLANVSISAVSYIMNNSDEKSYSKETIERVRAAAKSLNYVPNNIARGMRNRRSNAIGFVSFWEMSNRVSVQMMKGVMDRARELSYSVVLCPMPNGYENDYSYIKYYAEGRIDGLIIVFPTELERHVDEQPHLEKLKSAGLPYTIINSSLRPKDDIFVNFDFYNTTYTATNYLLDKGYHDITYVRPDRFVGYDEQVQRQSGYTEAMKKRGLTPDVRLESNVEKDIFDYKAVVTNKSDTAKTIVNTAIKNGIKISDAFPIIAGNTESYSEHLYYPLTTIQIPFEKIGKLAAEALVDRINGKNEPLNVTVDCYICERESTKTDNNDLN